jgi:tetratricopeptide (TPR) repeat protein
MVLEKPGEAAVAYRAALKINEQLAAEFPSMPAYAVELGGGYCNFGLLIRDQGDPLAALDWFAKAIRALELVLQKEQRLVIAREFLHNAHLNRAEALDMLHRHAEAVQDWDRAIELDDGQDKAALQKARARSLILSVLNQNPAWPLLWGWPRW